MARKRYDRDQVWLRNHASSEEFLSAFKAYCATQWGLPTFGILRRMVEAQRKREPVT